MLKNLLFWAAFPFLIPQALRVKRTAPRFAPAGGPTQGSVGEGREVRLLAIGDSIVAGVGASELSRALVGQTAEALAKAIGCRVQWQALGASGFDSAEILERLVPQMPPGAFDYIVLSTGVNDVTGLSTIRSWRGNLSRLLGALREHSPDAVIAVAGMPPLGLFPLLPQPLRALLGMRGRALEQATKEVVNLHPGMVHVIVDFEPGPGKFAPDGYHPSEDSYTGLGRGVAEGLVAVQEARRR